MLFGTFKSQFSQIWLFLKWFGTQNLEIYLLFGSKFWKILHTVWLQNFWDLANKLRNLALFIWEFGSEALPGPNITGAKVERLGRGGAVLRPRTKEYDIKDE